MMHGLGALGEFDTWRLKNGEMPARLLLKSVLDVVSEKYTRDFQYTLARDGDHYAVSIRTPGQNQILEVQEALAARFGLDSERDPDDDTRIRVPVTPLRDAVERQEQTEVAN